MPHSEFSLKTKESLLQILVLISRGLQTRLSLNTIVLEVRSLYTRDKWLIDRRAVGSILGGNVRNITFARKRIRARGDS